MKIHVTQKHIDRGIGCEPQSCAMALAIEEGAPGYVVNAVGLTGAILTSLLTVEKVLVSFPRNVQKFIIDFDHFKSNDGPAPKPTTFDLPIPEQTVIPERPSVPDGNAAHPLTGVS